jgi:hypothetical protein
MNMEAKGGPLKIGSNRGTRKAEELIVDQDFSPCAALDEIKNNRAYGKVGITICRQTLYNYIDKGIFMRLTNKDLPFMDRGGKQKRAIFALCGCRGVKASRSARRKSTSGRIWTLGNGHGGVLPWWKKCFWS